jgi:2-polyprenyl-3-methyl-5-hydroxy-6-metoxy-1,4-benzoquinol methylase
MLPQLTTSTSSVAAASLDSWRSNADFWNEGIGADGNMYWKHLQEPALDRMLGANLARPGGARALELATGNGLCARWMAARGARVLATDGAEEMLGNARTRWEEARKIREGGEGGGEVEFARLDVTEGAEWEAFLDRLAGERFDVVLCNMAVMDISTLEPMAAALPRLMKDDGV